MLKSGFKHVQHVRLNKGNIKRGPTKCQTAARHFSLWHVATLKSLLFFPHLDYSGSLFIAEADTLEGRRERLAQRFFRHNVLNETSYLHYLLKSQERSQDIVNRLRSSQTYEHYSVRTETFKRSFIPFSVNNILSGVLAIIAFYLTFYVTFFITSYCMA